MNGAPIRPAASSTPAAAASAPPVPSPCNSICRMSPTTGFCEGCFRTLDEIATWGSLDDKSRQSIVDRLRDRAA